MTYLIISVILMAAELAYFKLADRFNIIDKPNLRSSHTTITLRGGGIVFYFGAMAYFIVSHGCLSVVYAGTDDDCRCKLRRRPSFDAKPHQADDSVHSHAPDVSPTRIPDT